MHKATRSVIAVLLAVVIALPCSAFAATTNDKLDKKYWPLQTAFNKAVEAKDNTGIITSGEAIMNLFLGGADPAAKAAAWKAGKDLELNILRNVAQKVAEAHEAAGNFANAKKAYETALPIAVAWQELNNPTDTEFVRTIYLNKISAYDVQLSVYAEVAGEGGDVVYHGAKFEPKTGVYYGEVHTEDSTKRVNSSKAPSAGLFYVQYETETMKSFDWTLRPLTKTRSIVEVAWNLKNEGDTLAQVPNDRAKIEAAADYLKSLGTPILLRFGAEMNVWEKKADPAKFIEAYRFVSKIMKERASNVAMLWSPNIIGHVNTTYSQFYPGDEYVDWVGVSLYTIKYFKGNKNLDETSQAMYMTGDFANPVKQMEALITEFGGKKPIILSECGVENYSITNGENVAEWAKPQLRAIYETLPIVYPQIKAMLYFNTNPPVGSPNRFTLYENREVENLYKELIANSYFIAYGKNAANLTYKKLGTAVTLPADKVVLRAYAPYVKTPNLSITYRMDGKWIGMGTVAPYKQTFNLSTLADGEHVLEVSAASGDKQLQKKTYTVVKAGNSLTITAKQ